MPGMVRILCAARDRQYMRPLMAELDDGETCVFDLVTSGSQALDACRQALPDILVIDAVLPGMDGLGVVECMRNELGSRMPRVIGIARTPFARQGFLRRDAGCVLMTPCTIDELEQTIRREIELIRTHIDWDALRPLQLRAGSLLMQMGMHPALKGYAYLCCAAALACENENRLFAVGREIYEPVAQHMDSTGENVERLIRHAIESTMNAARARGVYVRFGNTIDPAKGKPTNAQMLAQLVQQMRIEKKA